MRRPTRLFRTMHLSKLLVVVLSLPLLTVALSCTVSQEEAEQADTEISDAPIDVRVTAYHLSEDYKSNELAANQKYDDKVLAVTGTIEEISGGNDGAALYVDLETGDFSFVSVRCPFSDDRLGELLTLAKGDEVTLRGLGNEGEDRDPFTIDVIGCSVIK